MSKAFTSEETTDDPIVMRPRAPLPAGVPNYTTARGLSMLREEMATLEKERDALAGEPLAEAERRTRQLSLGPRLAELAQRIGSAEVMSAPTEPPDEIRFGAEVQVRDQEGQAHRYQIVGVDEADARHGRVAFISPIARALLGRRVGDRVEVPTPGGDEELVVVGISY